MHPAFLDEMSWEMAEVYGAITDQILINLARHFPFYVAGEDLPKSAFAYQASMLAQMGQVNAETMRIIRNGLADADPALVNCLEQSIMDAVKSTDKDLAKAVQKGIFLPPSAPVLSPNQYRAFDLYYKQAADKLNLVNTVMLESTQSAYRQAVSDVVSEIEIADRINRTQIALDAAAGETVTGVSSWNQALRHATDKLNNGGIVGFIDHAGHRWSAEAYVAMDIRTTVYNTGRAAVWETNENFGNDLYIVSYHNGARPLCYPWQNKVISSLDAARTVTDLDGNEIEVIAQSATSYGAPAGLFGINCKHYPSPFIPGVSIIRGQPQDKEDNDRVYEQSQEQRRLERKLREEKRDLMTANAQGRPQEEIDALQQKCKATSGDIDEFCKKTGRARHRDREGVYTKREFPDAKKYDVTAFEREQKDMVDGWFNKGGAQQNFTAGKMTPNIPTPAPVTPAPVTPTAPVEPQGTFTPAKTRAEAEEYARQHFADRVDYKGLNLDNANRVNEELTRLQQKYPTNRLEYIEQKQFGAVARANYRHLDINGKKLGKVLNDEEINFKLGQAFTRNEIRQIESRYVGKAKLPYDAEHKIELLNKKLQYKRYSVGASYPDRVGGVIDHEYGHIIADQYFGQSNGATANPHYDTNWSLRGMYNRWDEVFRKAIETGDIYSLSEYGSRNVKEFFAESFAAREAGETLPDYVEELLVEVLNNGIM